MTAGAYLRLFDKVPKHRLHTWMNKESINTSPEQCARMCVLEVRFQCQAFNYETRERVCRLTQYSEGQGYGVTQDENIDFYERKSGANLILVYQNAQHTSNVMFMLRSICFAILLNNYALKSYGS